MAKQKAERSIREALEDAIDESEGVEREEPVVSEETESASEETTHEEKESAPEQAQEEVPEPKAQTKSEFQSEVDRVAKPHGKEPKPPVDWDVNLKQHWPNLPPEVRQVIADRERNVNMLMQQTDLYGQQVNVDTPDPVELEYLYDFSSIFATPEQESLFVRPFDTPAQPRRPVQPFVEGGQVNDLTDKILRILGET